MYKEMIRVKGTDLTVKEIIAKADATGIYEKGFFRNRMNEIKKNKIPKIKVSLLMNSSKPLSFCFLNNASLPPVIIWPASLALLLWSRTIAINNTDTINSKVSIKNTSVLLKLYHKPWSYARNS